jgi:cardiolipin synthase
LLLLLLAAPGCLRLPEVQVRPVPPGARLIIVDDHGPLAPDLAQARVLERLGPAPGDALGRALREQAVTGAPLSAGNRVELLFDGPQTLGAMMASIQAAKVSINLETYIFEGDELGQTFANLLIAKQQQGVQVNLIYDAVGTVGTPEAFFERMRTAGIRLCKFNPLTPFKGQGWRPNERDHRKILVVDDRVAFAGGANISGTYKFRSLFRHRVRPGSGSLGWRDTHLKLEGPAVASLQRLFAATWAAQTGRALAPSPAGPPAAGEALVRVVAGTPDGSYAIYRAYLLAIAQATRSIHLTASYFVPDPQLLDSLKRAAKRGVAVEIVLTTVTESSLLQHASQASYRELLESGVRLFRLNRSLLHAKTAVVDGVWSTVGSSNLDRRSFLFNQEVNVIVLGAPFGQELENAFREDQRNSTELTLEFWLRRSRRDRLKDQLASWLGYFL